MVDFGWAYDQASWCDFRWGTFKETRWTPTLLLLKIWQNSEENAYAGVSFLLKLKAPNRQFYQDSDSGTIFFLWT